MITSALFPKLIDEALAEYDDDEDINVSENESSCSSSKKSTGICLPPPEDAGTSRSISRDVHNLSGVTSSGNSVETQMDCQCPCLLESKINPSTQDRETDTDDLYLYFQGDLDLNESFMSTADLDSSYNPTPSDYEDADDR